MSETNYLNLSLDFLTKTIITELLGSDTDMWLTRTSIEYNLTLAFIVETKLDLFRWRERMRWGSVGCYLMARGLHVYTRLVLYENLHHIQDDVTSGMQGQTNGSIGQLIQPLTRLLHPDASISPTSHHRTSTIYLWGES